MIFRRIICSLGSLAFVFKRRKVDLTKVKRIAVLKSGAIGDILMSTPFLRALRKGCPNAVIDFHLGKWSVEALQNNPHINNIFTYKDSVFHSGSIREKISLIMNIKKQKYDLLFILDKSYLASLLGFATGIKFRIGFDRYGEGFPNNINVKYGPARHEIDYYLDLAEIIGIQENNKQMELIISREDKEYADKLTENIKNYIGIIPGGAKNPGGGVVDSRKWPAERFIELTDRSRSKYTILLLGGKTDFESNEEIIKIIGKKHIFNLAGKTTVAQSCELMRRCKFVICNDSGPMHIAAAAGTQIISLFGPTNPARKAPLGKNCIALWKDGDIYDASVEIYGAKPKNTGYFKRLSVEDVLKKLRTDII